MKKFHFSINAHSDSEFSFSYFQPLIILNIDPTFPQPSSSMYYKFGDLINTFFG